MRVLISGGGTAGHVYPALTVAEQLVAEHDEVEYIGTANGLEAAIVPNAGIPFKALAAAGFNRSRPWTLLTSSARIAVSAIRAWGWMGDRRPDVVLGFGGYVSIPVGLAAVFRKVPLVLLEQNSVPGLANRFLSRWAVAVGLTYEESAARLAHPSRASVVGNPVRADVIRASRDASRRALEIDADALVLLVFGGSRGARHINEAVVTARERLLAIEELIVLHVTGKAEYEKVKGMVTRAGDDGGGRWRVIGYCDDMGAAIAASDLVVARAGATSIAEITALGVPAVLIPYPFATDDHQTHNATTMVDHGAARLIPDTDLETLLCDELMMLLQDSEQRATMSAASRALGRPDAAQRVVALCRKAAVSDGLFD